MVTAAPLAKIGGLGITLVVTLCLKESFDYFHLDCSYKIVRRQQYAQREI